MALSEYTTFLSFLQESLTQGLKTDALHSIATPRHAGQPVLYVPGSDPHLPEIAIKVGGAADVRKLPGPGEDIEPHALLWLPHPYIMAGPTRYREQYYWDSYFTLRGLLALGEAELAQGVVRNFFYEIDHYGTALNANRGWALQVPRSQPPFLSAMVLDIASALGPAARTAWLKESLPYLERTFTYWRKSRFSDDTGLFHYGATGPGADSPCAELVRARSVISASKTHYEDARDYFRDLPEKNEDRKRFYDAVRECMTGAFYINDRAMREAGCDPSDRFGPFSCRASEHDPVCLNSLLARHCLDTGKICAELGDPAAADGWKQEADRIAARVNELMWDERQGLYFDYDRRAKKRSIFGSLVTAFPLYAGIAPPPRAERVRQNIATRFETEKSLRLSEKRTGKRWDDCDMLPYVAVAVEGLLRYGFEDDARRIATKRVRTIFDIWKMHGTVPEKFDSETGAVDMSTLLLASANHHDGDKTGAAAFAWNAAETLWAEKRFGPDLILGSASTQVASPPFVPELISGLPRKKYAVIRDACFRSVLGEGPSKSPDRVIFTGGLSGLGKTTMVETVLRPLVDGVIDANDLRNYHPRYAEFMAQYGTEMARGLTRDFCDVLAVDIQNEAVAKKRSFVREGTLQLPASCIPEALQSAEMGRDVVIIQLVAQAGDEELGRHMRHWEMQGDKDQLSANDPEAAKIAYVREIEHTYDDARAQASILYTLAHIEEGLRDHTAKAQKKGERIPAHRIIILGTDADIKYVNDFSDVSRPAKGWEVCALEYDRARRPQEGARLAARVARTRALMHNFGANDREWLVFQRLVDNRLAHALPPSHTGRPQRDLARAEAGLSSKFSPQSVWTDKVKEKLVKLMARHETHTHKSAQAERFE